MKRFADREIRLKYEQEYDLLSVWRDAPPQAETVEIEPGISVRVSHGRVIGLEIVDACARLHKDAATLESASYAEILLEKYGRMALSALQAR